MCECHKKLYEILWELKQMSVDLSKLSATVDRLDTDVDQLLAAAAAGDPTAQAAVDALQAKLGAEATKVEQALAATGATGVSGATGP